MNKIRKICSALLLVIIGLSGITRTVRAEEQLFAPEQINKPEAQTLYARSAVLMDADSGRILYEKNGFEKMPNASTTKILTCILAIESKKMDELAEVSDYAASMPKVRLGMHTGDKFLLKDLLYSLMLESHNDSAVVIAEHIGGTVEKFASMMNKKAQELGCENTYFITPNGLDGKNKEGVHGTTAADLALMMRYCIQNETFLEITRAPAYTFSNADGSRSYSCNNHNAFLSMMEGALSGKTGFTGNAGYCYIGSLRQGDRTFIVSLLACGWPNHKSYKWADTRKLMNYGLTYYNYEDVFEHGKELSDVLIPNGVSKEKLHQNISLPPNIKDTKLILLKNKTEKVTAVYEIPKVVPAPVTAGEKIGQVTYYLDNKEIASYPVTLTDSVEELNFKWYARYLIKKYIL